ncbi:MAG: imidazole glycerol phosphate synthase subunit HisH [Anaerolineae bacterium]|nr:imidazole glycerol phosphate synthase subunit HisH [Anaerolineae bacterium]
MIAIVDYGIGNIRSVFKAFQHLGAQARTVQDARQLLEADGVVLPGVAAFGDAMAKLQAQGLTEPIREAVAAGKPFLGICVGMQVLFAESEELGRHRGLGLLPGRVRRFPSTVRVPQIGWNQVFPARDDPLLAGLEPGAWVYFAHSYYAEPADPAIVLAETTYGLTYPCVVGQGHLYGIQFHPEKSQEAGLRVLRNFIALVEGKGP